MTSIMSSLFQAMEDASLPRQDMSSNDLTSFQNMNEMENNAPGYGFRRNKSEITLTPYGVFKAVERFNLPAAGSSESLVSLSSQHSFESLSNERETLSASLVYKAMEDLSLGSYASSASLSSLGSNSPKKSSFADEMKVDEKHMVVSYLKFFFNTLEDFLNQTNGV